MNANKSPSQSKEKTSLVETCRNNPFKHKKQKHRNCIAKKKNNHVNELHNLLEREKKLTRKT